MLRDHGRKKPANRGSSGGRDVVRPNTLTRTHTVRNMITDTTRLVIKINEKSGENGAKTWTKDGLATDSPKICWVVSGTRATGAAQLRRSVISSRMTIADCRRRLPHNAREHNKNKWQNVLFLKSSQFCPTPPNMTRPALHPAQKPAAHSGKTVLDRPKGWEFVMLTPQTGAASAC